MKSIFKLIILFSLSRQSIAQMAPITITYKSNQKMAIQAKEYIHKEEQVPLILITTLYKEVPCGKVRATLQICIDEKAQAHLVHWNKYDYRNSYRIFKKN